jgi:hypothetical protein
LPSELLDYLFPFYSLPTAVNLACCSRKLYALFVAADFTLWCPRACLLFELIDWNHPLRCCARDIIRRGQARAASASGKVPGPTIMSLCFEQTTSNMLQDGPSQHLFNLPGDLLPPPMDASSVAHLSIPVGYVANHNVSLRVVARYYNECVKSLEALRCDLAPASQDAQDIAEYGEWKILFFPLCTQTNNFFFLSLEAKLQRLADCKRYIQAVATTSMRSLRYRTVPGTKAFGDRIRMLIDLIRLQHFDRSAWPIRGILGRPRRQLVCVQYAPPYEASCWNEWLPLEALAVDSIADLTDADYHQEDNENEEEEEEMEEQESRSPVLLPSKHRSVISPPMFESTGCIACLRKTSRFHIDVETSRTSLTEHLVACSQCGMRFHPSCVATPLNITFHSRLHLATTLQPTKTCSYSALPPVKCLACIHEKLEASKRYSSGKGKQFSIFFSVSVGKKL